MPYERLTSGTDGGAGVSQGQDVKTVVNSIATGLEAAEVAIAETADQADATDVALTAVTADVATLGSQIGATDTALTTLTGRVTTAEGDIVDVSASLQDVADTVNAARYTATLEKIARLYESAQIANPRIGGVMASPPAVTANSTTLPAGQTNGYLISTYADLFRVSGGTRAAAGRLKSAVIWTSGGNIGDSLGGQVNWGRYRFIADANKIAFRVSGTTAPYRFIVDGKYVSLAGTTTTGTATSPDQYLLMDFTSAGGRKQREIIIEMSQTCGFVGAYVGATEKIFEAQESPLATVSLGDSYCYGSNAACLGDGIDAAMADNLGWARHMNSGSGGTGWATVSSAYTFQQRIANGDIALCGAAPDVITLQGSSNDKNATEAAVKSGCLTGLQSVRALYPQALIFVFGVWPASGGAGTLSPAQNEAALLAAVTEFGDDMTFFIPIDGAYSGSWLSGTGFAGSTTGSGNADVWMSDASHLNEYGTYVGGALKAQAIYRLAVSKIKELKN